MKVTVYETNQTTTCLLVIDLPQDIKQALRKLSHTMNLKWSATPGAIDLITPLVVPNKFRIPGSWLKEHFPEFYKEIIIRIVADAL